MTIGVRPEVRQGG